MLQTDPLFNCTLDYKATLDSDRTKTVRARRTATRSRRCAPGDAEYAAAPVYATETDNREKRKEKTRRSTDK